MPSLCIDNKQYILQPVVDADNEKITYNLEFHDNGVIRNTTIVGYNDYQIFQQLLSPDSFIYNLVNNTIKEKGDCGSDECGEECEECNETDVECGESDDERDESEECVDYKQTEDSSIDIFGVLTRCTTFILFCHVLLNTYTSQNQLFQMQITPIYMKAVLYSVLFCLHLFVLISTYVNEGKFHYHMVWTLVFALILNSYNYIDFVKAFTF